MATTITAQKVFDIAMGLMDEVNETTGATDTSDTKEYKNRTLLILNSVINTCYPYSSTYTAESGTRAFLTLLTDFTSPIGLDDAICTDILPYYLAAMLLMDENPSSAGTFLQTYNERFATLARGLPSSSEDIEDVYGSTGYFEYNHGGEWG